VVGSSTGSGHPDNLIMTILHGVDRRGADGRSFMPAFADQLTDAQVAAIAAHVLARFGRPGVSVTEADVATARAGGPRPLIVTLLHWGEGLALAVVAVVGGLFWRNRRRLGSA